MEALSDKVIHGDVRAAARLMRLLDDGDAQGVTELKKLYAHTGRAYIIGVTGPPGAGKSTLVDHIVAALRAEGKKVGVIAVDPSSPFSGGAILGDRIRMQRHYTDPDVFIRSLASRGHLGGLTASTEEIALVMDAMGKDVIILETVGVGQDEVEVIDLAHTSIVITVPGLGDEVQAMKAGVMEIGNIFVVNKADREGAERTQREILLMIDMVKWENKFRPPVVLTQSKEGLGIDELMNAIKEHNAFLEQSGQLGALFARRAVKMFEKTIAAELEARIMARILKDEAWTGWKQALTARAVDPYSLADEVLKKYLVIKE